MTTLAAEKPIAKKSPSCGSSILIADDDPISRRLLHKLLEKSGFDVIEAEDGLQALEKLHDNSPDLILLDCNMPGLNGFEVCEKIQEDPAYRYSPVIFVTGNHETNEKLRGFHAGGVDYVTKPIEPVELLARIGTHIELSRMQKQQRARADLLEGVVTSQSTRLDQVKRGQLDLLADTSEFPELQTAVIYKPAAEAGGDFYDIIRLSDNEIGVFIADISGHDLEVAYFTGALKALIASFASTELSVEDTMASINAVLLKLLGGERFVTAVYAKILLAEKQVRLINAGHPPVLIHRADGELEWIDTVGDVLGMHSEIRCGTRNLTMEPRDRLYLYSDGLIEGYPDSSGKTGRWSFGKYRLESVLKTTRKKSLGESVDTTMKDLLNACNDTGDDVMLLGVEFDDEWNNL